jgi:hypothetical protein
MFLSRFLSATLFAGFLATPAMAVMCEWQGDKPKWSAARTYHHLVAGRDPSGLLIATGTLTAATPGIVQQLENASSFDRLVPDWKGPPNSYDIGLTYLFRDAVTVDGRAMDGAGKWQPYQAKLAYELSCQEHCHRFPAIGVQAIFLIDLSSPEVPAVLSHGLCPLFPSINSDAFLQALSQCARNRGCTDWLSLED